MKPLRDWIKSQMKTNRSLELAEDNYGSGVADGYEGAMKEVLAELKAREDAEKKQGPEVPAPSGPGRFTNRIADLRRDLSVAANGAERSKISQELLDAEDEHQEDVGEDMVRARHAKAQQHRGPKGGYPRETWGDDDGKKKQ